MGFINVGYIKDVITGWFRDKISGMDSQAEIMVQGVLDTLRSLAQVVAPYKTGELAYSHVVEQFGLSGFMYPTVLHAIFVILGTEPHTITPVRAKVLAFQGGYYPAGEMVFATKVEHPGTKPNDYMDEVMMGADESVNLYGKNFLEWIDS